MTRLEWNKAGERLFETGVDQVVLYPGLSGTGVPWNGVVSINEGNDGGGSEPMYYDGIKRMDAQSYSEFTASIEAYSAPREFNACDGIKELVPGMYVGQQPRRTFGLSYRTLVGNDLVGENFGYKLHLVYNITAQPSDKSNSTIGETASPGTRSWSLSAVPPVDFVGARFSAHLVFDSTRASTNTMEFVERQLHGADGVTAQLPRPNVLFAALGGTL